MKEKLSTRMWITLGLVLWLARCMYADGFMIGRPVEKVPWPHAQVPTYWNSRFLSVQYHHVTTEIEDGIATTSIDQVFLNESDVDMEGTYIFPVPETAAIKEFSMYINGKKVSGQLLDKEEARAAYETILRQMKDPGLLEYVGRNMFKARVYPIPKHGKTRIGIEYQETLSYDAGVYQYVYPLNTERFSPMPLEDVSVAVRIRSAVAIKNVYSSSHPVDIHLDRTEATCGFRSKNERPDKDFVLFYTLSDKKMGVSVLTDTPDGDDGYFMMLVSPGEFKHANASKDIVFVIDTSGSMAGEKIDQAKEALLFCLNNLGTEDRFNIVPFATAVHSFERSLVIADGPTVRKAEQFVRSLRAEGGTDINTALAEALAQMRESQKPQIIIFLTDGQPTVGEIHPDRILATARSVNKADARVFVFGVGTDVNTHLLDMIANDHRAAVTYVVPGENIEIKVSAFYRKVEYPVLTDVAVSYGSARVWDVYPKTLPDIFSGGQLIITGRFDRGARAPVTLTGYVNGKKEIFAGEQLLARQNKTHDFIPRIWANRKIGYCVGEIRLTGQNKELVDEIVRLSKKYGIMTPYTSYLVLEHDKEYERWGIPETKIGVVRNMGMQEQAAMDAVSGAPSVTMAQNLMDQKESIRDTSVTSETVQHIARKTFYLQQERWVDSEYEHHMNKKSVRYLSDEYFQLLREKPELRIYFSRAKRMLAVVDGFAYETVE